MGKPRPEKKPKRNAGGQLPLPTPRQPGVLPMELQVRDRLTDETGEWEIIARPYTTAGGKDRARSRPAGRPA